MTFEQANNMIADISWSYGGKSITKQEIVECRETCHEALEKQIPKKIKEYKEFEDGTFYRLDFRCPVCGNTVIGQPYKPDYCKHCGQALDWRDTE